jgi:toxin ParE1/3/4
VKLVWLPRARINLDDAIGFIAQDSPRAALDMLDQTERQSVALAAHPMMGRVGRVEGTRELVIARSPFILIYRVKPELERVEILRLLHGAQEWP